MQKITPTMGRDPVFGNRGVGFTNWSAAKAALDQRLGNKVKPWRVHDLRRSVATHMGDLGVAPHLIEACLNHYSGHRRGVAGVYNRARYDREVTAVLERWATYLEKMVLGEPLQERKSTHLRAV
jgi:hypothetical protein